MAQRELNAHGQTISPLPPGLRHGLIAITVLALISFLAVTILFLYLSYKLISWHFYIRGQDRLNATELQHQQHGHDQGHHADTQPDQEPNPSKQATDFVLGIDGVFSETRHPENAAHHSQQQSPHGSSERSPSDEKPHAKSPPNQFIILIYNLFLADMHQSAAFLLNASWLRHDGIMVNTPTCFTQGLFVSTGDLASSMFITAIAIHTYLSVVKRYRPPQTLLYGIIIAIWAFVYAISTIPIAVTRNGRDVGGFFVRAGAWCWINRDYENLRLFTHYLFIFMALATTSSLYLNIFITLRRRERSRTTNSTNEIPAGKTPDAQPQLPGFLIYPIIYVLCTLPLAVGRIAIMAGAEVPVGYFCFAGAIIAFNGFFDCVLFGTTRNSIVFASKYDISSSNTGLDTFAFLQTPRARRYGNMIWIQGGRKRNPERKGSGGWWSWQRLAGQPESSYRDNNSHNNNNNKPRSLSQESLRGRAIQMDMVTTVVVEQEADGMTQLDLTTSASPSVQTIEKGSLNAM